MKSHALSTPFLLNIYRENGTAQTYSAIIKLMNEDAQSSAWSIFGWIFFIYILSFVIAVVLEEYGILPQQVGELLGDTVYYPIVYLLNEYYHYQMWNQPDVILRRIP